LIPNLFIVFASTQRFFLAFSLSQKSQNRRRRKKWKKKKALPRKEKKRKRKDTLPLGCLLLREDQRRCSPACHRLTRVFSACTTACWKRKCKGRRFVRKK